MSEKTSRREFIERAAASALAASGLTIFEGCQQTDRSVVQDRASGVEGVEHQGSVRIGGLQFEVYSNGDRLLPKPQLVEDLDLALDWQPSLEAFIERNEKPDTVILYLEGAQALERARQKLSRDQLPETTFHVVLPPAGDNCLDPTAQQYAKPTAPPRDGIDTTQCLSGFSAMLFDRNGRPPSEITLLLSSGTYQGKVDVVYHDYHFVLDDREALRSTLRQQLTKAMIMLSPYHVPLRTRAVENEFVEQLQAGMLIRRGQHFDFKPPKQLPPPQA